MILIKNTSDFQKVIDQLLLDKESSELEFKSAAGGFPHSFWETYSSFANTNGGAIIFGVKEKNGIFSLDGLSKTQAEKYLHDFFNDMHNKQVVNAPLLKEDDVQIIPFEDQYFLLFYIPRVERNLRPVFCGLDPYTGTYRRDLEGDYRCPREEVNSMFADANLANPIDGRILKNFGIVDLDPASIKQYRRLFEQAQPDHVWNVLSDHDFLVKLNVFRKDRKSGNYGLTFAGLLMFGTYSSIMEENPNFFPDYREIQDEKERWVNRICPDGNWESNLFQFYRKVLPILQGFLPKPFVLEGNQRKNETSAHVAVREALANAIVHADYTENASLTIYKYPNKIIFSNPGTMLISLKQYYHGGESVCRNKYLQTMFMFLGSAEKAGSGADKIVRGWEEQNWKKPYIRETTHPNKVELTMSMESLIDENIIAYLSKLLSVDIHTLPSNQQITLALAYTEEEITNERLQYVLNMHKADITSMLSVMCHNNLLESIGYGRGTKYHIKGMNDTENSASSAENSASSAENSASSTENSASSAKKYVRKNELYNTILDFCKDWCTIEQIVKYTGKSKSYLRNTVLPNLSNQLEKLYPNIPNHPRQKYRTKLNN